MEQWSTSLTGGVQPGADADAAWQRVAQKLGQAGDKFERLIRQRLPVTFRVTDEAAARRQQKVLEACGVDAVMLADDGQRLWVRLSGATCGPVSAAYARRALVQGEWDGQLMACIKGESQWQPLESLVSVPLAEAAEPPPPQPSAAPAAPSVAAPAPIASAASPAAGLASLPTQAEAPGLHAGFWMRVAAYLLDYLIIVAAAFLVGIVIGVGSVIFGDPDVEGTSSNARWNLLGLVATWLYSALFESSSWQATPGKRMLGLQVVDTHGRRIGFGRATGRFFGQMLSTIILCIGYMMAGWTARKQALHDMMAGCCVVRKSGLATLAETGTRTGHAPTGMPGWAVALVVAGVMLVFGSILAAIALPAYQDYMVRSQTAEGLAFSGPVRAAVENYVYAYDEVPADNRAVGMVPAHEVQGVYVQAVEIDDGNVMLTYGGDKVHGQIRGKHLVLVPQLEGDAVRWTCTSPDMPAKYLPVSCRN